MKRVFGVMIMLGLLAAESPAQYVNSDIAYAPDGGYVSVTVMSYVNEFEDTGPGKWYYTGQTICILGAVSNTYSLKGYGYTWGFGQDSLAGGEVLYPTCSAPSGNVDVVRDTMYSDTRVEDDEWNCNGGELSMYGLGQARCYYFDSYWREMDEIQAIENHEFCRGY